jgi:hypothetical protein
MKIFRKLLRYWIGIASVLSFLGGWVILAHSPKPVQSTPSSAAQSVALPTLPPIQAYGGGVNNNGLNFFSNNNSQSSPQPSSSVPMLRTRGS